ncbi:gamma-aminobutyric acid type B receptor subunit 2-like, partial [Diadema antillarum]
GSSGRALDQLYDLLLGRRQIIAFAGTIEAETTKILAEVTGQWGVIQVGFANSAIGLSDHARYPYFVRTMGSSADLNKVKVQICQRFGWTRVSTITESVEPHIGVMSDFHELLETENITLHSRQSFYYDPSGAVSRLKSRDARIIIASFTEETARRVMCQVFQKELYGPKRVFIFRGFSDNEWWRTSDKDENLPCNDDNMEAALQSVMTVFFSMNARRKRVTFSQRTASSFRLQMAEILGSHILLNNQDVAANAHDAIWALSLGLNSSVGHLGNRSLEYFTYESPVMVNTLYRNILDAEFYGVSGPVSFKPDGDRIGAFIIQQIRDESRILIGTLQQGESISWVLPTDVIWERNNGRAPFDDDRTEEIFVRQSISKVVVTIMGIISALGVALALVFLGFNVKNRKKRHIKMSSPNLNNLIICGICLAYICVVLLGIDLPYISENNQARICVSRIWLISLSFTVAFGGMFTKMWRVYNIVINKRTMRKVKNVIKDRHLVAIIVILLIIDVVILITKHIIDPYRVIDEMIEQPRTVEDRAQFVVYIHVYRRCSTTHNTVWTVILVVYKAFIMLFGAFLSWQTRTISLPGLNDSYYVGLSIYNACLCCAVAVPLCIFNANSLNVTYTVTAGFILFCSTSILCTLFFPKISALYRQNHEVAQLPRIAVNTVSTSLAGPSRGASRKMEVREPTQLDEHNPINKKI